MKLGLKLLVAQAAVFLCTVSLPWMVLAPWPGSLKATAPILCPDDQPDALIVEYYTSTGDGTGTSWTLVCMGPGGDVTEVGSWAPLGLYLLMWLAGSEVLICTPILLRALRRGRRAVNDPDEQQRRLGAWTVDLSRGRRPAPASAPPPPTGGPVGGPAPPPPDPSTRVG